MSARTHFSILLMLVATTAAAVDRCPPATLTESQWSQLQAGEFAIKGGDLQRIALDLLVCLDDPDPKIRDTLAMGALTTWMREKKISAATARTSMQRLSAQLTAPDESGFGRPFAALALAEVARMDRIEPYLTRDEYAQLVKNASTYLSAIRDYRGFDEHEGWRHGVAHGADLLMQLALNTRSSKQELDTILTAVAAQVAPAGPHFYVYGESERLARPVLFVANRRLHSHAEWSEWLSRVALPSPFEQWDQTLSSQAGLAKRHNVRAFLLAMQATVLLDGDAQTRTLLNESLREAITTLP